MTRGADRRPRAPRPALPRAGLRALLSALLALRHAAPLLREVELVHRHLEGARPDARQQRDDRLAPRAHQARPLRQMAREQRRLGALARPLLGHAAADLALRGERVRRASGAPARSPSCASARSDPIPDDLHRPYIDEVTVECEHCGGEMQRVDSVIDTWYDSGAMPFAQFHYPFENEAAVRASASPPTTSARPRTRPAAGSTRCSPSRRCCSASRASATASASA